MSFIILSVSVSTIPDGISISVLSHTVFIASSSVSYFALFLFSSSNFSFIESFNSLIVSNSLTSFANSSSTAGNSFFFISCSFTLNTAAFPAKSLEKYSSGNVTFMSFSSPIFIPIIWSSNPGINVLLPITNSWFSAFPPSNATPSTKPSKSITVVSFFSTGLSSTFTSLAFLSCICPISWSMSFSSTLYSTFLSSIPLYFPNVTSGLVCTTAVKIKSFPFSIWIMSISGLLTASILASVNSFS